MQPNSLCTAAGVRAPHRAQKGPFEPKTSNPLHSQPSTRSRNPDLGATPERARSPAGAARAPPAIRHFIARQQEFARPTRDGGSLRRTRTGGVCAPRQEFVRRAAPRKGPFGRTSFAQKRRDLGTRFRRRRRRWRAGSAGAGAARLASGPPCACYSESASLHQAPARPILPLAAYECKDQAPPPRRVGSDPAPGCIPQGR